MVRVDAICHPDVLARLTVLGEHRIPQIDEGEPLPGRDPLLHEGIGGFASRTEDAVAYSLSGAGNMIENLQRITDARSSNLGCFVHLVFAALLLIGAGYLVQIIPL